MSSQFTAKSTAKSRCSVHSLQLEAPKSMLVELLLTSSFRYSNIFLEDRIYGPIYELPHKQICCCMRYSASCSSITELACDLYLDTTDTAKVSSLGTPLVIAGLTS